MKLLLYCQDPAAGMENLSPPPSHAEKLMETSPELSR